MSEWAKIKRTPEYTFARQEVRAMIEAFLKPIEARLKELEDRLAALDADHRPAA